MGAVPQKNERTSGQGAQESLRFALERAARLRQHFFGQGPRTVHVADRAKLLGQCKLGLQRVLGTGGQPPGFGGDFLAFRGRAVQIQRDGAQVKLKHTAGAFNRAGRFGDFGLCGEAQRVEVWQWGQWWGR